MQKQSYSLLVKKVLSTRSKETAMLLISGTLLVISIMFLTLLSVSFVEMFANGDVQFRTFLAILVAIITVAAFAFFLVPHILRSFNIKGLPTVNDIALRIGKYYPDVKDKLGNAIQLVMNLDKAIGSSQTLIEAEVEKVYTNTRNVDFDVIINKKRNFRIILFFLISSLFTVTTFSLSEGMSEAFFRVRNYSQSFLPPAPFKIELMTKNISLLRGSRAEIVFKATGTAPDYIKIHIKEENQQKYDEFKIKRDSGNVYKYEIAALKQNITFYGEATWLTASIVTDIGQAKVIDRPMIRSLTGRLHFPAYTKLAVKDIDEQTADIAALIGSNAELTITANKKIKNAYIVFEKSNINLEDSTQTDTFHINMKISENKATGNLRVSQNGFYYFVIEDFDNEKNINPIKYSVVALTDGMPSISLLFPTTDVQVTDQAILPIKVAITDDYGFSSLKLHYRLVASKYTSPETNFSSLSIPLSSPDLVAEIAYVWNLNKIQIVPEDVYEFYLEIADNDFSTGPKKAKTQILKVRLPSLAEVSKEADVSQNQIGKELDKVKRDAEQLKKNIEDVERELIKKSNEKELDWKQKKQIQDILQKQEQLQNKMQDLSEQVQQTAEQLQQNNMLSAETMQKYQELQKLMQEVRSPMLEQMRKMQESVLQNMSPDELRKAMEQAKFDEERFKKSIERTMEILKRMQAEQKTDALTKRAEALKQKQDEINKELNNSNANDKEKLNDLAKKQDQLQSELKNISKDMKDLEKLMKEIGAEDMPMQEMKEAMDALDNQEISEDMDSASDGMKQGDKSKSDKSQKSASKKIEKFAQKMRDVKKEMQNKNSKEVIRKLQKTIDNLANISKKQENIKNLTKRSDMNSTKTSELAEAQADVFENLYNVANDLNDIGAKSFAITPGVAQDINDALRKMRETMDLLTERLIAKSVKKQTETMREMNSAMAQLQDALAQMQSEGSCQNGGGGQGQGSGKGGGGGAGSIGFQQRMQQMAAEQQALYQQMQDMMGQGGSGGGGQYSQEQRAAMKRLADNQERIRKSTEELSKEQKNFGGKPQDKNENKKLANELAKLAEEMKEVTSDINSGNISPETLQRQEKILSKLLDAHKSINDRDYETKRESKKGADVMRQSPTTIDLSTQEGKTRAMQELMQSIKKGYTKDYEQIIRQYFEAIQKNY